MVVGKAGAAAKLASEPFPDTENSLCSPVVVGKVGAAVKLASEPFPDTENLLCHALAAARLAASLSKSGFLRPDEIIIY